MRCPAGISQHWWWLFLIEIPLVAGTVLYVLFAPEKFARSAFGIDGYTPAIGTLMASYASVVGTVVGWFYARVLLAPSIHLPTFRLYQEALLLGDVGVIAIWSWALGSGAQHSASAIGGIVMATFWGGVRVLFLWRHRHAE